MRYLFFILLLFVFAHCEKFAMDRRYSLLLKNNSDSPIIYLITENPDTSLIDSISLKPVIQSGKSVDLWARSVEISKVIEDSLSIYLFHIDTLKNNTWAEVQAGYKILKRYDLSLEDLEYLEYKLSYPPDAKMSGVKMYPPYP